MLNLTSVMPAIPNESNLLMGFHPANAVSRLQSVYLTFLKQLHINIISYWYSMDIFFYMDSSYLLSSSRKQYCDMLTRYWVSFQSPIQINWRRFAQHCLKVHTETITWAIHIYMWTAREFLFCRVLFVCWRRYTFFQYAWVLWKVFIRRLQRLMRSLYPFLSLLSAVKGCFSPPLAFDRLVVLLHVCISLKLHRYDIKCWPVSWKLWSLERQ